MKIMDYSKEKYWKSLGTGDWKCPKCRKLLEPLHLTFGGYCENCDRWFDWSEMWKSNERVVKETLSE